MKRGSRLFQKDLFGDEVTDVADQDGHKPGRSEDLIFARDRELATRYFWWQQFTIARYDYVLEQLELEFKLSASTITQRLALGHISSRINELKKLDPEVGYFMREYPYRVWDKEVEGSLKYKRKIKK